MKYEEEGEKSMEHLDANNIVEVLDRLVGDIHAYGETYHDNDAYENLKAYGEIFNHMLSKLGEESCNSDSYMASVQANGEKALKILINTRNEINDYLEDYDRKNRPVYVSVYYSFDAESPLYKFDSLEEAKSFIKKSYQSELKTSQEDDCADVLISKCEDGFARIVFDNDDRDIIEWNVCQLQDNY